MTSKAFQMIGIAQRPHELAGQVSLAFATDPLLPTRSSLPFFSRLRIRLRIITARLPLPLALLRRRGGVGGAAITLPCGARLSVRQRGLIVRQRSLGIVVECPVPWTSRPFLRWETHQPGPPRTATKVMSLYAGASPLDARNATLFVPQLVLAHFTPFLRVS